MGVVVNLVIYGPYHNARAYTIVYARVADPAFLEPVGVAARSARPSHGALRYQKRLRRNGSIRSGIMVPACSPEVDDTDDSENDNAQGRRARASPAGQDQEEEAGAVLKNVLY